jgi:hypothetical protein
MLLFRVTLFSDGSSREAASAATHASGTSHQNRTAKEPIDPEDNVENSPPDLAARAP